MANKPLLFQSLNLVAHIVPKQALLKASYTFEEIVLGRDASTISFILITGAQVYLRSLSVENTSVAVKVRKGLGLNQQNKCSKRAFSY